ncbi:MFS transporter [Deinococcus psychrotolerans]|uniref:MFS transporter n=1 Tax=Deinococcus psychrotolerans TaxID=2489213 RepID=A0A3G8YDV2_9DEIO|nr:MFS transporter [Deinococcus psychrotolerans]AZI43569.1 MFS transporter [Deinococcus psychrotolerans]
MNQPASTRAPGRFNLAALFLSQSLATGATTASTVLASLVMSAMGREAWVGLPSTLVTLGAAASAGAFGALMLRGRRGGLVAAYLLGVVGALVGFWGAWQQQVLVFLLGAALVGMSQGGFQQARYAAAESVAPSRRGFIIGAMMFASVLGSAFSTALSTPLADFASGLHTSAEVVGWLLAALFLLLGAGLTSLWRPPAQVAVQEASPQAASKAAHVPISHPQVWPAALAVAVSQGLMVTLMSLTPLRAHNMGMEHPAIAGLVTIHIAGMYGLGWLTGPLIDRFGVRFGYLAGAALLLLAALSAPAGRLWLAPSMFLLGLGWNLGFLAGSKALTNFRGAQGKVDALAYLTAGVGTLSGGLILNRFGFEPLAWGCAALSALLLISAWYGGLSRPAAAVATDVAAD